MRILFFDTETTGLPKNWKAPVTDIDNWPRIIQMAWLITDEHGNEIDRYKSLIKPDGWRVPTEKFWTDHGYSTETNEREGVPIKMVLNAFHADLSEANIMVSHNISFDQAVAGAEMIRLSLRFPTIRKICTKDASTDHCRIPGNYGKYKWPKLSELHQVLFKRGFEGAHDALGDVSACKDCFFELVKLKVITL